MNAEEVEKRLESYLRDGIVADIFLVDQAYALTEEIGKYAEQINAANFGELFGSLQVVLSDRHTLAIAKIFDSTKRYPTRSIPATLDLLEDYAELWRMPQRQRLHRVLVESESDVPCVEQLSNAELTHAVVAHFRDALPDSKRIASDPLSSSLTLLRQARNKVIAHNEAIEVSALQAVTWKDATSLVNYAKEFVATIGFGYLNTFFGKAAKIIRSLPMRVAYPLAFED